MKGENNEKNYGIFNDFVILVCSMSFNAFGARTTATATFGEIGITINGEEFDVRPLIINGTSYFPVRTLGYALNCTVEWISDPKQIILTSQSEPVEAENYSQSKDGTYGTKTAIFDDSIVLYADGKIVSTPIAIVDDRSYVPIKQIAEAMGKRATWYADTRTIRIVNPDTVVVDEDIADYYVYDLPEITSEEDYLVGNWVGYISFNSGQVNKEELFISKNSDGTYSEISKETITENPDNPDSVGNYIVIEYTGTYDSSTDLYTDVSTKIIDRSGFSDAKAGGSSVFKLQDEILHFYDGNKNATGGYLTRF